MVDEEGKELPSNSAGELLISGPMVTPGYWKNLKATNESKDGEWFKTGDVAKLDEESYNFV